MKWKNVGNGAYESGPWTIVRHDGYPHPGTNWAIYKNLVFIGRRRTLSDAKNVVLRSMEAA